MSSYNRRHIVGLIRQLIYEIEYENVDTEHILSCLTEAIK